MFLRQKITTLVVAIAAFAAIISCNRAGDYSANVAINNQSDSLSYVVGMNIAYNIMKLDSTLNPAAVVKGINDALSQSEVIPFDEARTYFLTYMNFDVYERVKIYEEQYLTDLAKSDKDVVRSQSGLTYKVAELGNMSKVVTRDRDSVAIIYRASRLSGEEVDLASNRSEITREAVSKLIPGLKEGVKLIGEGGKLTLWIPSSMAYGSAGAEQKGIKTNEMLRYEVELKEVIK
jgi:FKBP-type peptidyl-prolyl cis-trans isomerase